MSFHLFVCELGTREKLRQDTFLDVNSERKDKFEILRKFVGSAKYTNYFHFAEAAHHKHHFFLVANDCAVLKI